MNEFRSIPHLLDVYSSHRKSASIKGNYDCDCNVALRVVWRSTDQIETQSFDFNPIAADVYNVESLCIVVRNLHSQALGR